MALDGVTIGSGAAPSTGGALSGVKIGASAPAPKAPIATPSAGGAAPDIQSLVASTPAPPETSGFFSKFLSGLGNAIAPPDSTAVGKNPSELSRTLAYLPSELARAIPGVAEIQDSGNEATPEPVAPKILPEIIQKGQALTQEKTDLDASQGAVDNSNQTSIDAFNARVKKYNDDLGIYQKAVDIYNKTTSEDVSQGRTGNKSITDYIDQDTINRSIVPAVTETAQGIAKAPITAVADVWDVARVFIGKNPNASFNVPGLGQVNSDVLTATQAILNGTDPIQAVLQSGASSIFNVLFFADIVNRVAGPRAVTVAETNGNLNDYTHNSGMAPRATIDNGPKTGRLYEPAVATSKTAQVLPPEVVAKMKAQGITLGSRFNPDQPVFLRVTQGRGGSFTGEIVQLKPSYLQSAYAKLFGSEPTATLPTLVGGQAKAPTDEQSAQIVQAAKPDDMSVLHSSSVESKDLVEAANGALATSVTPPEAPAPISPVTPSTALTVTHNALRLLKGDTAQASEGAAVLKQEIQAAVREHGSIVTHVAIQEQLGVDPQTADRLIQEAQSATTPDELAAMAKDAIGVATGAKALPGVTIASKPKPRPVSNEVAQKAYELTKENGGVTIDTKGGVPSEGFAYAPEKGTEMIIPKEEFSPKHVDSFIEKHADLLTKEGNHIGMWESDGNIYLDISRVGAPTAETIEEAQKANQLAIFDLKNFKEISTGQLAGDVYTKRDEAANILDQYQREVAGAGEPGSDVGTQEVPDDASALDRAGAVSGGEVVQSPSSPLVRTPNEAIQKVADDYNASANRPAINHEVRVAVDVEYARKIAAAYDELKEDNSADPAVAAAYNALKEEVLNQWNFIVKEAGVTFTPWEGKSTQPYQGSAEMMADLKDNNHLYFFTGGEPHAFLDEMAPTGFTYNEMFRAVHDYFGHAAAGLSFSANGEENAWLQHSQMFSDLAQRALTTETRGQNSWVNYGKQNFNTDGDYKNIPASDRPYAVQKVDLLPRQFSEYHSKLKEEQTEETRRQIQTRGFIKVPALPDVGAKISEVKDFIEHSQKTTELTGNVNDALYQLEGARKANRQREIQLLETRGNDLTPQEWENVYHYDENHSEPLTEKEKEAYESTIVPIKDAQTKARAEYRELGGVITSDLKEDLTPRFAKEKGGPIDKLLAMKKRGEEVIRNGGLMSKSVGPGAKHRIFHIAVDKDGVRHVVSINAKQVTAFKKGVLTDLGKLNSTSEKSLLQEELAPIQKAFARLKKEASILEGIKVGTTGAEARIKSLEEKALTLSVDLFDTSKIIDDIQSSRSDKRLKTMLRDIRLLSKIKPAESIVLRAKRLDTLREKMEEATQEMLNIEAAYSGTDLNDRVFVDKNGQTYKIGQATTKEIEANTKTRYHKNPLANYVLSYDRTISALSALKLQYHLINNFPEVIQKQIEGEAAPDGWLDGATTGLPQFRNTWMDPKVHEAITDLATRLKGREPFPVLDEINNLLTSLIVLNPIMHFPNVAMGWGTAEAATGKVPFLSASSRANFVRAVNEVKNKGPLYLLYLEHGAPLMALKNTAREFTEAVLTQYSPEVEAAPDEFAPLAKALGYANPMAWFKGLNHINEAVTWGGNDIMFLHALLDHADRTGSTPEEAIKAVSKRMADYRLPSRIGPGKFGRAVSLVTQSRGLLFARYHYSGVIKPWIENVKDSARPGATNAERLAGLRALAYLGLMAFLVYPYIDKMLRGLTGDDKTYISMAGASKLVQNTEKLYQAGSAGVPAFAQSTFTLSPALTAAIELGFNVDLYTRNPIYGNPPAQGLGQFGVSMVAPLSSGSRMSPGDFALSLLGIYTPKTVSAENTLNAQKYDELPALQVQVKKDITAGLTDKADAEMAEFNNRAIANWNTFQLQTGGQPLAPDGSQNDAFLKEWGIRTPGTKALTNASALYGDGSLTSKSSLLDKVTTYAKAIATDPVTAFSRIFTGQQIVRVDNFAILSPDSAVIVQRLPLADSEAVRTAQAGVAHISKDQLAGLQLDHFIPLEAGGTNESYNLDLVTTYQNEVLHNDVEAPIAAALRTGAISRAKAQEYLVRFKIGTLGEHPNQKYIDLYKNEYNSQPITAQQVVTEISAGKAK